MSSTAVLSAASSASGTPRAAPAPAVKPPSLIHIQPAPAPTLSTSGAAPASPPDLSLHDVANGPLKDGRVRNPVPSKLQGKTKEAQGNFGVMHMALNTRADVQEREGLAKRTSESTEAAAKAAHKLGYQPISRRKYAYLPEDLAAPRLSERPPSTTAGGGPVPSGSPKLPVLPSAAQTKEDQARLLTLLRSLHPILVVDQLCKALAFFGGIPGAPPPADSLFPESGHANGSGAIFVGWMSEIFPNLEHLPEDYPAGQDQEHQATKSTPRPMPRLAHHQATRSEDTVSSRLAGRSRQDPTVPLLKRPRGRPKGSKTKNVRKERLTKRSLIPSPSGGSAEQRGSDDSLTNQDRDRHDPADSSWVDVEDTELDVVAHLGSRAAGENDTRIASATATADAHHPEAMGPDTSRLNTNPGAPTPRRRGRPKGSKNRPKVPVSTEGLYRPDDPGAQPSPMGSLAEPVAPLEPKENRPIGLSTPRKRGRPKGVKNRPKEDAQVAPGGMNTIHGSGAESAVALHTTVGSVGGSARQSASGFLPVNTLSTSQAQPLPQGPPPPSTSAALSPSQAGAPKGTKRKRNLGVGGAASVELSGTIVPAQPASQPIITTGTAVPPSTSSSTPQEPPSKRARNSNTASHIPTQGQQTPNVLPQPSALPTSISATHLTAVQVLEPTHGTVATSTPLSKAKGGASNTPRGSKTSIGTNGVPMHQQTPVPIPGTRAPSHSSDLSQQAQSQRQSQAPRPQQLKQQQRSPGGSQAQTQQWPRQQQQSATVSHSQRRQSQAQAQAQSQSQPQQPQQPPHVRTQQHNLQQQQPLSQNHHSQSTINLSSQSTGVIAPISSAFSTSPGQTTQAYYTPPQYNSAQQTTPQRRVQKQVKQAQNLAGQINQASTRETANFPSASQTITSNPPYQGLAGRTRQQGYVTSRNTSASSANTGYPPSVTHSISRQRPSLGSRPTNQAPTAPLPGFEGYPDFSGLDMPNLDDTADASALSIATSTYGLDTTSIQNAVAAAAFGPASGMTSSSGFDTHITEPSLRDGLYHGMGQR